MVSSADSDRRSTPGAAMLATSLHGVTLSQTIGIFLFTNALIVLCGVTGLFARLMKLVPQAITAAMLAGILLRFGTGVRRFAGRSGAVRHDVRKLATGALPAAALRHYYYAAGGPDVGAGARRSTYRPAADDAALAGGRDAGLFAGFAVGRRAALFSGDHGVAKRAALRHYRRTAISRPSRR